MGTLLLSAALVINELMASNAGVVMSPATNFDSWIEVYNPGNESADLGGMYLSNDADNLKQWQLPSNIGKVPAKGFMVLWLGSHDIISTNAPFKLDCDGGTICLSDRQGNLVVRQDYPSSLSRSSYARITDGGEKWAWTAEVTPGASNAMARFANSILDAPEVSAGSCLFDKPFNVKVKIPNGTILMYTTDGTVPTSTVEGTGKANRSVSGSFTVSSTTNYVFRLFKNGYLPSAPVTRSYIMRDKDFSIPVVSIVGDNRYFKDPVWGIDVKGVNGIPGNGRNDSVNWNQPWDRPVNFSYISPDGKMLFNQDVNICVSGGWSRMSKPRSFKLKSNKVFDGHNHLDYPFFPQKPYIRNKTLVVRNGGNDYTCRFKDPVLTTIVQRSGIDLDVQSTVQVAEYINGEFRGVLNLREPNNDKFVYANWGYDDDEIDAFENSEFKNGTDEAFNYLVELSERINESGVYDEVKTLLDIDEFTNYMAAEIYLGNRDWPNNNVKGYRRHDNGRFRFVLFDLDQVFSNYCIVKYANTPLVRLFKNLLGHEAYRRKFLDTFCLMGGSVFEPQRITAITNELADAMRPMLQLDGHSPDGSAMEIKEQLSSRLDVVLNQLQDFKPAQTKNLRKQSVQLSANTDGATLLVNGMNLPYASFKGYLFPPVTLEAKAPAGYIFKGWKKSGVSPTLQQTYGYAAEEYVSTSPIISLPGDEKVSLVASFAPMNDKARVASNILPVRINEVSAANGIYINDYIKRSDWVELYNTTDKAIDVEGMYLSDAPSDPRKYQIEAPFFTPEELWGYTPYGIENQGGTVIPSHGYLIVWCDQREPLTQLHTSFKLAAGGGDVILTASDGSWSDKFTYNALNDDQTAGRYPDGCNDVFTMNIPTIGKANILSSYATSVVIPNGDVNADGIVDVADMAVVISVMAEELKGIDEVRTDVNRDGSVDVADINSIIDKMAEE